MINTSPKSDITTVHHSPNTTHLYQHVAQLLEMSPLCDLLTQKVLCVCAESVWPIQTESNSAGKITFITSNFQCQCPVHYNILTVCPLRDTLAPNIIPVLPQDLCVIWNGGINETLHSLDQ